MIEQSIKNFVLNSVYRDVLDYKQQGRAAVIEEYEVNQWSYIVEIMIITIKSLKPSGVKDGNIVDYRRFKTELELWKSYRHGMNRSLLYSLNDKPYEYYFDKADQSTYARMAIITLGNENWDIIKNEVLKNILFTSGKIETILECLIISKMLYLTLDSENYEYEEILKQLKDEAISFSQIELSNYDKYYRMSKSDYQKKYQIEFERKRIDLISLLNGIKISDGFKVLENSLKVLNGEAFNSDFFTVGLFGIINKDIESREIKDFRFIENLAIHLTRLRKGRVDGDNLELKDYVLPEIFDYKLGDVFVHPVLNKSKVIYKGQREGFEIAYIETQTGIYRFINLNRK